MKDFFKRLDKFMEYKGLNDNQMTIETGISNGLIGKGRKRGTLSQSNISKILSAFPELNANWLLMGQGDMLQKDISLANEPNSSYKKSTSSDEYTLEIQKKLIKYLEKENAELKKELGTDQHHSINL